MYYASFSIIQKKKRIPEAGGVRYSSAPSLVSPLPAESTSTASSGFSYPDVPLPPHGPPQPHHLAPLTIASGGSSSSSLGGSVSQGTHTLSRKEQAQHSMLESKPKRLVMVQDSPLTQQKLGKTATRGGRTVGNHSTPLQPLDHHAQRAISPQNPTLLVQ